MTRIPMAVAAVAFAVTAFPAGAFADDSPTSQDKKNASAECRTERGTTDATREAFRVKYGTNKNGKNAFGKCVSKHAKDEKSERKSAHANAAKDCKAERGTSKESRDAFDQKYGTNGNKNNSYGKCVSSKQAEYKAAADAADKAKAENRKNAAETCDAERGDTAESREAFKQKYGTNKHKRNAFGKCVSAQEHAQSS